jgi:hypothetical protein
MQDPSSRVIAAPEAGAPGKMSSRPVTEQVASTAQVDEAWTLGAGVAQEAIEHPPKTDTTARSSASVLRPGIFPRCPLVFVPRLDRLEHAFLLGPRKPPSREPATE